MITVRTVEPATEPVTLTEAKAHFGVTITDDDTRITSLIVAARQQAEHDTRRSFVTQTWRAKLDGFPAGRAIDLPHGPIQSVTSVQYVDGDGVTQGFTDFTLDADGQRILLDYGESWPSPRAVENAVTITYVAGYGAATAVPEGIKSGIKLLVEIQYDRPDAAYSAALKSAAGSLLGYFRDYRNFWGE
jgi:uncharacterized phiE125 gp8 family phage protein